MIAHIKGTLQAKGRESVIIETGGIGYRVFVPLTALESLNQIGAEVKVHTYMHVREDACVLYGFLTEEELKMFEQLIRVSGVGPKAAISLVSYLPPSQFGLAVLTDDADAFVKAPGIGKKTALKIILELKDKLKKEQGEENKKLSLTAGSRERAGNKIQEAVGALMMLGYSSQEANLAVSQVYSEEKSLETIIRESLKSLAY
ncbi:MAG: Holliday junction branch migration protein RuvA [Clostridiaceae bacterium]|jgi:Holliday junction DNA helicase RuvA|nr:Holliday junction branch migration protein RuvA [Clostridiaceae bacterium]